MVALPAGLADAGALHAAAVAVAVRHLAVALGDVTLAALPPDLAVAQPAAVGPVVAAQYGAHACAGTGETWVRLKYKNIKNVRERKRRYILGRMM